MTQPETFIHKDKRTGWRAETKIPLGDNWQLDIGTRKTHEGWLVSSVTVGRVERGFVTHRLFTDYSRYAIKREGRCTDKVIEKQHDEALSMLATIIADVRDHYARMNETIPDVAA